MTRTRHLWIVPLAMAVIVAFVGWWANLEVRRTIQREVANSLQANLDADVTALEIWMTNQQRFVASLAEDPQLREATLGLLNRAEEPSEVRPLTEPGRLALAREHLPERLRILGYSGAMVVGTNYEVVGEVDLDRGLRGRRGFGRPLPRSVPQELRQPFGELFSSGQPIVITPFKLPAPLAGRRGFGRRSFGPPDNPNGEARGPRFPRGGPLMERFRSNAPPWVARLREIAVMQVAAPIKDDEGITRGALTLRVDPDSEFTRILSVALSGQTGETIAFDSEGVLISRSRFEPELRRLGLIPDDPESSSALALHLQDPGGDLTQGFQPSQTNASRPLIELVNRAFENESGLDLKPSRDYRGVLVVGAWRWLPDYDFGVLAKVDAAEAFRPLRLVRGVFVVLFLLLVLAALVIFLFTYWQVVWRRRVTEAELKARQLGQYQLQEKIGEGGMGIVYRAHHALLRRDTALKLLPPDRADQASVDRFEREVRLTCRLTHPNTIQVYDYGHTPEGIFYYAMEFLEGLNLQDLVHRYGAQPDERVLHILAQVCDSLAEAHALGLIHRDIKPANIFICDRGGIPDCVKVLDFGLVKSFADGDGKSLSASTTGQIVGTPQFIAPESLKDATRNDMRSDIYSLGALGYYLLTGGYVFDGGSVIEICQKHITEEPQPPGARLGRPVDALLEEVILRCLSKDPDARPQTVRELGELLRSNPLIQAWTLARRAEWWTAHSESVRSAKATGQPIPASSSVPTVKIAMGDRTV